MVSPSQKTAMAETFVTLAEFYKYPNEEFHRQLASQALLENLAFSITDASFACGFAQQDFIIPKLFELQQEFTRCFIGINGPSAVPIESIYKVWTTDKSAQLSIANKKGYLMGDAAIHIRHLLDGLGLEIPEEYRQRPDHLTILLELLAYLINNRNIQEVSGFLRDHFDWLTDFQSKLLEIKALPLYIHLTDCLIKCIAQAQAAFNQEQ